MKGKTEEFKIKAVPKKVLMMTCPLGKKKPKTLGQNDGITILMKKYIWKVGYLPTFLDKTFQILAQTLKVLIPRIEMFLLHQLIKDLDLALHIIWL